MNGIMKAAIGAAAGVLLTDFLAKQKSEGKLQFLDAVPNTVFRIGGVTAGIVLADKVL